MAFGNLPQIDPSFLMQKQANIGDMLQAGVGGFQQGLQLKQQMDAQKFQDALKSELATGAHDYTTPEGQASLVKALAGKGFGPEAMDLAAKFPKPKPKTYQFINTTQGVIPGDTETGRTLAPLMGPDKKPIYDEATTTKMDAMAEKKRLAEADFNFGNSIPNYEKQLAGIGSDMTKRDLLASKIMGDHPDSAKAEKYIDKVVRPANAYAAIAQNQSSNSSLDYWKNALINNEVTPKEFESSLSTRGGNKAQIMAKVYGDIKKTNPEWSPFEQTAGSLAATNSANRQIVQNIDAVIPNMNKMLEISNIYKRGGSPAVNQYLTKANIMFGDKKATEFTKLNTMLAEDLNKALAGTGAGSDAKLSLAQSLADPNISPENYATVLSDLNDFLKAKRGSVTNQAKGFAQKAYGESPTMNVPDAAQGIAKPVSRAERDKLAPGTKYIGPDGKVAIKQ